MAGRAKAVRLLLFLWKAQFIRFGIIGVGALISYAILTFLAVRQGFDPVVSSFCIYLGCTVGTYLGHRLLTFTSRNSPVREMGKFLAVSLVGLFTSTAIMGVTQKGGLHPYVGIVSVSGIIPIVNFVVFKLWVFRQTAKTPPAA